jgi:hypothetical protein
MAVDDKGRELIGDQIGLEGRQAQLEDIFFKIIKWSNTARVINRDGHGVAWALEAIKKLTIAGEQQAM